MKSNGSSINSIYKKETDDVHKEHALFLLLFCSSAWTTLTVLSYKQQRGEKKTLCFTSAMVYDHAVSYVTLLFFFCMCVCVVVALTCFSSYFTPSYANGCFAPRPYYYINFFFFWCFEVSSLNMKATQRSRSYSTSYRRMPTGEILYICMHMCSFFFFLSLAFPDFFSLFFFFACFTRRR